MQVRVCDVHGRCIISAFVAKIGVLGSGMMVWIGKGMYSIVNRKVKSTEKAESHEEKDKLCYIHF